MPVYFKMQFNFTPDDADLLSLTGEKVSGDCNVDRVDKYHTIATGCDSEWKSMPKVQVPMGL
jgi:hypothetical protein